MAEYMSKETFDKLLDNIMDYFDFNRVLEVMKFLKWEWYNEDVPDIYKIKSVVRENFRNMFNRKYIGGMSTGGFEYVIEHYSDEDVWNIHLRFVISEWWAET